MKTNKNVLIIFLKYPEPGKVKTRLAQDIGSVQAASLYKKFVEDVIRQTRSDDYQQALFITPANREKEMRSWLKDNDAFYIQEGKNLGESLFNAFKAMHSLGAENMVVIGTDCPLIDQARINEAFEALLGHDLVIGPSEDGGYYLLGLKALQKEIFEDIAWSQSVVFEQTMAKAEDLEWTIAKLKKEYDVDTLDDFQRLRKECDCYG